MQRQFFAITLSSAFLIACAALANAGSYEEAIAERIKPVGTVCVAGDPCAAGLAMASAEPKSGEQVYNQACMACHASGAAGAPKHRNKGDWSSRLAAGIDTVYANAINGIGAMPAKGLCMTCSDDEIKAAVDYMVQGL
ncbi:MAG: cytochrome c5 family protein [Pseudomonadales bacterium]|nr:c-type cytochrome [Gammaproteobacteria bacterium]NNL56648.1 cytochrome c5 family protein [Pseudomonadales bacterium]